MKYVGNILRLCSSLVLLVPLLIAVFDSLIVDGKHTPSFQLLAQPEERSTSLCRAGRHSEMARISFLWSLGKKAGSSFILPGATEVLGSCVKNSYPGTKHKADTVTFPILNPLYRPENFRQEQGNAKANHGFLSHDLLRLAIIG